MDEGPECTCSKFADNMKLRGVAETPEDCFHSVRPGQPGDLDQKEPFEVQLWLTSGVLPLGMNNCVHQYSLEAEQLKEELCGEELKCPGEQHVGHKPAVCPGGWWYPGVH